jgi:hypothetical protein
VTETKIAFILFYKKRRETFFGFSMGDLQGFQSLRVKKKRFCASFDRLLV